MQSKEKPQKQPAPVRRTHKTKEDFLRWLREKETRNKKSDEDPKARTRWSHRPVPKKLQIDLNP